MDLTGGCARRFGSFPRITLPVHCTPAIPNSDPNSLGLATPAGSSGDLVWRMLELPSKYGVIGRKRDESLSREMGSRPSYPHCSSGHNVGERHVSGAVFWGGIIGWVQHKAIWISHSLSTVKRPKVTSHYQSVTIQAAADRVGTLRLSINFNTSHFLKSMATKTSARKPVLPLMSVSEGDKDSARLWARGQSIPPYRKRKKRVPVNAALSWRCRGGRGLPDPGKQPSRGEKGPRVALEAG
ncbi:hypothetical protein BCR39DRAFT_508350 [Naematelia encephala]|uniref:Uncharacterized protein n=1 Tax=Naematelia encephala TaxID=71784 RepID=A0A1Y2AFY7_9TREE|nr:hypothetical protein BCR39DRAFT_508350 [Naematelia encephala]